MKNDRQYSSCWLSGVGCLRKYLPSSFLLILLLAIALTLMLTPPCLTQQRWERTYGGTGRDEGYSVQQTEDGGYIVAGAYDSYGSNPQVYLIKTNASGDTLWTRTNGGADWDCGFSVQQTMDGGYIVGGYTNSFGNGRQVYLFKTNALGDTLWTRNYGGAGDDYGFSVRQTSDTGYIVAGVTWSFGNSENVYLIKTNATGDTLWTRTYGGADWDCGYSVQQTQDGGYIVVGYTTSFGNGTQIYLIKTNASGDTLWTKTYGGTDSEEGYSTQQTQDGGYIVTGGTLSFGYIRQVYLIRTNASGDTLWTRNYGGTSTELGRAVQQTQDRGYVVAGNTSSFGNSGQVYLIKTSSSGDTLWCRTYGGTEDEYGYSVQQTSDGGYIVTGYTSSFGNGYQLYLIKTDVNGNSGIEDSKGSEGPRALGIKVTPNPFTTFASVPGHEAERFELYDIAGRKIGIYQGDRIGEGLAAGVYFLKDLAKKSPPVKIMKLR